MWTVCISAINRMSIDRKINWSYFDRLARLNKIQIGRILIAERHMTEWRLAKSHLVKSRKAQYGNWVKADQIAQWNPQNFKFEIWQCLAGSLSTAAPFNRIFQLPECRMVRISIFRMINAGWQPIGWIPKAVGGKPSCLPSIPRLKCRFFRFKI